MLDGNVYVVEQAGMVEYAPLVRDAKPIFLIGTPVEVKSRPVSQERSMDGQPVKARASPRNVRAEAEQ